MRQIVDPKSEIVDRYVVSGKEIVVRSSNDVTTTLKVECNITSNPNLHDTLKVCVVGDEEMFFNTIKVKTSDGTIASFKETSGQGFRSAAYAIVDKRGIGQFFVGHAVLGPKGYSFVCEIFKDQDDPLQVTAISFNDVKLDLAGGLIEVTD